MKMSNDGQYAKAKKDYGKDFYAKEGSSSDSGLKKGATTMEKDSVKVGRFATGGALRQPRDGNMKFASGGSADRSEEIELSGKTLDEIDDDNKYMKKLAKRPGSSLRPGDTEGVASMRAYLDQLGRHKSREVARDASDVIRESLKSKSGPRGGQPMKRAADGAIETTYRRGGKVPPAFAKGPRHSTKEDAADIAADKIDAKKRGMKPSAFEGTPADERMDKMGAAPKFPRNKAAKFATGGGAKPVKRNMGGMMGGPLQPPQPGSLDLVQRGMTPGGANPAAGAMGRLRPQGIGQMAVPSPPMASPDPMQGGEGGQFRKGGAVKPVKLAMGGVGKQRHGAMSKSGSPTSPKKASKSEQVI